MATKKSETSSALVLNNATDVAIMEQVPTTEAIQENVIEDAEIVEIEKAHKSDIVSEIKRRASNLDRFQNGRSTKFNGDKYIYRKLLALVPIESLEALNNDLKAKLEKLI